MGKILFWNIAGAGVGMAEDLSISLLKYAAVNTPDCIVVCEMRKLSKGDKVQVAFGDYKYVKPSRPQQTNPKTVNFYGGADDKRLYVYALQPGAQAMLIATGNTRPVVVLAVKTKIVMVMHAPSVSSTSKPQAEQMKMAYDIAAGWAGGNIIASAPVAIFGDLNVDLMQPKRVDSLTKHLGTHTLASWKNTRSGQGTHHNKKTDKLAELDWALSDPNFKCSVSVAAVSGGGGSGGSKDEDMDWTGEDQAILKSSDHVAVLLTW